MTEEQLKPLNWNPAEDIGYTVSRRPDGGMHFIFTDVSQATLEHWRAFALDHLLDSDRLTRNLYDLRQIHEVPEKAIAYALEVDTDPSVRNVRLAVVVSNEDVRAAIERINALTVPPDLEMAIFDNIEEAEAWLNRPLTPAGLTHPSC